MFLSVGCTLCSMESLVYSENLKFIRLKESFTRLLKMQHNSALIGVTSMKFNEVIKKDLKFGVVK